MEKCIYDKSNGLWYELKGDCYIPCLLLPVEKEQPIVCGDSGTNAIYRNIKEQFTSLCSQAAS